MVSHIQLGDITVEVILKDIKNIHLSVYPPTGRVRISAPQHMDLETIRIYAISKVGWIKEQQQKFNQQDRETPREYLERESHYLWGNRFLLQIVEVEQIPTVELSHKRIILKVRPGMDQAKRQSVMDEWYRRQVRQEALPMIEKWEQKLGVRIKRLYIQRMKTHWGSCKPDTGNIRLNTELAKKPRECLEYIVVHELTHLIESTHNNRFVALMDQNMPHWRQIRDELNRAPLGHVEWEY